MENCDFGVEYVYYDPTLELTCCHFCHFKFRLYNQMLRPNFKLSSTTPHLTTLPLKLKFCGFWTEDQFSNFGNWEMFKFWNPKIKSLLTTIFPPNATWEIVQRKWRKYTLKSVMGVGSGNEDTKYRYPLALNRCIFYLVNHRRGPREMSLEQYPNFNWYYQP